MYLTIGHVSHDHENTRTYHSLINRIGSLVGEDTC